MNILKYFLCISAVVVSMNAPARDIDERMLGKLFTTPAERQQIDVKKSGGAQQTGSRRVTPSSVTLDGIVIRSKGKNSVWVNGNKMAENETVGGVKVITKSANKNNIRVPVLVDGKTVRMKPGQSWSEETEAIVDNY